MALITNKKEIDTNEVSFKNVYGQRARQVETGKTVTEKLAGFMLGDPIGDRKPRLYGVTTKKSRFSVDEDSFKALKVGSTVKLLKEESVIPPATSPVHFFSLSEVVGANVAATVGGEEEEED